jgi:hypothetical protein
MGCASISYTEWATLTQSHRWFGDDSNQAQSYQQFQDTPPDNSASLSHEAISGAASYEVSIFCLYESAYRC